MENDDPWEDLGSREKSKDFNPYRHFKEPPLQEHESLLTVEERKQKNLTILLHLDSLASSREEVDGTIRFKIQGKTFDFWPASNTYFIHSTNQYGVGIEKLVTQILKKLGNT